MSLPVRILLYPFIFASSHMLYAMAHFLCIIRLVSILWFHFWQITIIYSIGQASAGRRFGNRQKFFQTFLLIFHQGVERIEKESLYLIWQCVLWEVINQWHHKALRLTRTSTRGHDYRLWLIVCRSLSEQYIPAFILMLVWRIFKVPQFAHQSLGFLSFLRRNWDIWVHALNYRHGILRRK